MANSVLVAYATKSGSTAEVAEAVADALRKGGHQVDLQPAGKVRNLEGYDAVVLGAPLYMFHWHKDARRFLTRFRKTLESMKIAVFALGPSFNGDEAEFKGAREQLDKDLADYAWLKPAAIEVFGGKFVPEESKMPFKMFMKDVQGGDFRDWKAIESWAKSLTGIFSK